MWTKLSYESDRTDGLNWTLMIKGQIYKHKHILSSKSPIDPSFISHSSHNNLSCVCHIGMKLHPHLDEGCIYLVPKNSTVMMQHSWSIVNLLHILYFFWDTLYDLGAKLQHMHPAVRIFIELNQCLVCNKCENMTLKITQKNVVILKNQL